MDGLSVAASVIAVVDVSAKILVLCSQYYKAVAGARADISRLQTQLQGIKTTLEHAKALVESPQGASLTTSRDLQNQLSECHSVLQTLASKLEAGTDKAKRRAWLRSLKWPFSSKETEGTLLTLERYHRRIMDGLQIDQTTLLLHIKDDLNATSKNDDVSAAKGTHFMMDFDQDPHFVLRPAIQAEIDELLAGTASRVALTGFGGFGKSQLAIHLAYAVHSSSPERSVFWVYGASRTTFEDSYRSIANKISLPGRNDHKADILALVRDWLQRDDVAPWLLILDNADETDVFFDKTAEGLPLASYLPKRTNGKIFITSRNRHIAEKLAGNQKAILHLPVMSSSEAMALLGERLIRSYEQTAASDLVQALDFIPLAIHQAAAYINRRRISISAYIETFRASEEKRARLLTDEAADIRRYDSVSNSVAHTWRVTANQLLKERPGVVYLLAFLSCFQPRAIPHQILLSYKEELTRKIEPQKDSKETLEDDLEILFAYSLISESTEPRLYDMHSLVQICIQAWLSEDGQRRTVEDAFITLVTRHLVTQHSFASWQDYRLMLPHLDRIFEAEPDNKADAGIWMQLLNTVSQYLIRTGNDAKAATIVQRALNVGERLFGMDDPLTLVSLDIVAQLDIRQEKWQKAEKAHLHILEVYKQRGEMDHPSRLSSMETLASINAHQRLWDEAERLQRQALEMYKKKQGEDHGDTLSARYRLAEILRGQGRWDEAETLQVQAMERQILTLGTEHPNSLVSISSLATAYKEQNRVEEAARLLTQATEARKGQPSADNADASTGMTDFALALMHAELGQWQEAEALQRKALEAFQITLGAKHEYTLVAMEGLAVTIKGRGRTSEAIGVLSRCASLRQQTLGADHAETVKAERLVSLWQEQASDSNQEGVHVAA